MRAFILLAVIAAVRADSSGYSYSTGNNGGYRSLNNDNDSGNGGSLGSGSLNGGSLSGGSLNGGNLNGGGLSGGSLNGGNGGGDIDYSNAPASNSEFNKEFFTYTAPEAEFNDGRSIGDLANSLKKNLQVVFIKGPENTGLENAALNLAKSAIDSRTAIYVLNKQTDLSDLANKLQNLNSHSNHKPDVHFVKYRTPEDALHAQRTIQQEYERLGGATQAHNGGIAPVLDFSSKAPAQRQRYNGASLNNGNNAGDIDGPGSSYIPPSSSGGNNVNTPSPTYLPIAKLK